jgi:tetratricopeptide (TPR) repeat protein
MIQNFCDLMGSDYMERLTRIGLLAVLAALLCVRCAAAAGTKDYLDYFEQGEFAMRVQQWRRAVILFSKSLQNNPKFFAAYHNRAVAYSKLGEYEKSIRDLQKAVQLNPDYPDAFGLMGMIYEIKKDYPNALRCYREALSREKRPTVRKVLQSYIQAVEAKTTKRNQPLPGVKSKR